MEETIGCNLLNTRADGRMPSEFTDSCHVHVLVKRGSMAFFDGKNLFSSLKGDLVIWQMSNHITQVTYSDDFEADFLLASPAFLQQYNPEMVWASKGFIFIRLHPSFHLDDEGLRLMEADFRLFRYRLSLSGDPFRREALGRVMQIFLYDLWTVYRQGLSLMETTDNAARIFLRFLELVQREVRSNREPAYYADRLCITSKYLSQVCREVTGLPASEWITYYAAFELVSLLNDTSKTLTEISDLMNFSSLPYFSRYVKKVLGKTPSEYRQQ